MQRLVPVLVISLAGCGFAKEKVGDYVTEAAVESIERKIDAKLHERDLSLKELKTIVDLNGDQKVEAKEVFETAKAAALDVVTARLEVEQERRRADLEAATSRLKDHFTAEGRERIEQERSERARDLEAAKREETLARDELFKRAREGAVKPEDLKRYEDARTAVAKAQEELEQQGSFAQDLWGWIKGLFGVLIVSILSALGLKAKSAHHEGKRDQRIDALEKLTGLDLDANGTIGGRTPTGRLAKPAGESFTPARPPFPEPSPRREP